MTIPASFIVDVQPRVISGASNDLEMNGLVFSRNEIISSDTLVLEFGSAATVGAYFGLDSEEYAAAQIYFQGYTNKFSAPRSFFVARRIDDIIAAWVRSAPNTLTLAQYQAITDGSINVSVDGTAYTITGVSFAAATSLSDVGEILAAAIAANGGANDGPAVTCMYSSLNKSFTLESPTLGADSMLEFPTDGATGTGLATAMHFTQASGAVHSSGSGILSIEQQMVDVREKTENWVSFTTLWEEDAADILAWAQWANNNYGWLYVPYTTDPNTPNPDATIDPASQLVDAGYDHTALIYGTVEYAVFLMGAIASISWQRLNGSITLAFKRQAGLAPFVVKEADAATLESKRCNYFGDFATRNAQFSFLYNGIMSGGIYTWIDAYINSVWFNNRLQVAILSGLSSTPRVPYNERGYTFIRAWMLGPVEEALNNAVIEPDIVLSEAQKTELFNEAGMDISGELAAQGYYIQILDPGPVIRGRRETPIVNIWYTYGSSVHRIEVASTAVV